MANSFDDLVSRARGEYREMPGLRLTSAQAQRLWGLSPVACDDVLSVLTAEGFLQRTLDNKFVKNQGSLAVQPVLTRWPRTIRKA